MPGKERLMTYRLMNLMSSKGMKIFKRIILPLCWTILGIATIVHYKNAIPALNFGVILFLYILEIVSNRISDHLVEELKELEDEEKNISSDDLNALADIDLCKKTYDDNVHSLVQVEDSKVLQWLGEQSDSEETE